MRTKDREYLNEEAGRRMISMFQRISQVRQVMPFMPRWINRSEVRRMIVRLRNGTFIPPDPTMDPLEFADFIEQMLIQDEMIRAIVADMYEVRDMSQSVRDKYDAERTRRFVTDFHRLKQSPEAHDPESVVAERLRQLDRLRRQESERPRGRNRKG